MASFKMLTLVGLLMMSGYAMAFSVSTNGTSGEPCGPDQKKCQAGMAECDAATNKCKCLHPYAYGSGDTNCYKNNTFRTEVFNDPNVLTYNGNSIGLPIPCRYFWTHTRTWLKNKKRTRVGYCEFQAYAFHHKSKGKFYVGGYDVAIRVTFDDGRFVNVSIRKHGYAKNGLYFFIVNATNGHYLPHGDWEDDVINYHDPGTNLRIRCEFDLVNNLAIIHVKKCGITIKLRPYDLVLKRNQPQIPFISYEVNCAFHPTFLNPDKVVAIPPAADHGGMTIDEVLVGNLTRVQTLMYRAFFSMAEQNSPYPNTACEDTPTSLGHCNNTTLKSAFDYCDWMLTSPRFIRCWDDTYSGEDIMTLFNKCIDVFCNGASCPDLITEIKASDCHEIDPPYEMLTKFVNGTFC